MPALSSGMESGKIISWLKRQGDMVQRGDAIAEIETDKATVEMEATVTGLLIEILRQPGEEIEVGVAIAFIEAST